MAVELLRIDDRLVHGQVVEGWLKALRVNHIVVVSDSVEADDTQKALYLLAVPNGVELTCATVVGAAQAWKANLWKSDRALILVSTPTVKRISSPTRIRRFSRTKSWAWRSRRMPSYSRKPE